MNAVKQAKKNRRRSLTEKRYYLSGVYDGADEVKRIVCEYISGKIDKEKMIERLKIHQSPTNKENWTFEIRKGLER